MSKKIYIPKETLMYSMVQKCSYLKVLEIFLVEPRNIHFIKEISKKINLAHTSVRNNIQLLLKEKLIVKKKSKPFDGYVANRDNENFIWYKRAYNLTSLKELVNSITEICYPKSISLFGSYSLGEDIESSDIDLLVISKIKKDFDLSNFEKLLKRKINIIFVKSLSELDSKLKNKVLNGFVLYGGFDE
ncbi:nucleotidyltransferase domain-containing protein [Candidatus Pacearchaeota archaeon]|nr:nucleotidyltransferase domain-containing protein [Candidatus Pacearchaeota archaeon]